MDFGRQKAVQELQPAPLPEAPPGYVSAEWEDRMLPLICQRCGASVIDRFADLHDAWHAARMAHLHD